MPEMVPPGLNPLYKFLTACKKLETMQKPNFDGMFHIIEVNTNLEPLVGFQTAGSDHKWCTKLSWNVHKQTTGGIDSVSGD